MILEVISGYGLHDDDGADVAKGTKTEQHLFQSVEDWLQPLGFQVNANYRLIQTAKAADNL